jgi:hypothetical protein
MTVKGCSTSPTVHANCDSCGQRPEIIHKPAGTGGARYCPDCCPVCHAAAPVVPRKPKQAAAGIEELKRIFNLNPGQLKGE